MLQETAPAISRLLRLEGLVIFALGLVIYARLSGDWWLAAALFLLPDLSMLAYLFGRQWGARVYNFTHSYMIVVIAALPAYLGYNSLPYAALWLAHIGFDRMQGYGLKSPEGFHLTHLKMLGPQRPTGKDLQPRLPRGTTSPHLLRDIGAKTDAPCPDITRARMSGPSGWMV